MIKPGEYNLPIRIGVNAGSLEKDLQVKYGEPTPEALVESAMRLIDILDRLDFPDYKLSLKASDVFMTVAAYRIIASQIEQPLHLGITEAGGLRGGTVKSSIGLGMLLMDGIGDTLRGFLWRLILLKRSKSAGKCLKALNCAARALTLSPVQVVHVRILM